MFDISRITRPDAPDRCSFCGKTQAQVMKLIAGSEGFICDGCVEVCNDVLAQEAAAARHTPAADPYSDAPADDPLPCLICGGTVPPTELITIPSRGAVCRACAGPVRAALTRALGTS